MFFCSLLTTKKLECSFLKICLPLRMAHSSSTPPSSNKLLITDPNPKSRSKPPPTAPPNSATSSSTASASPPEKRTRDQPNLSDCHCCGGRINNTYPKDRLQPLDSVWRIVLLCRKCRRNVRSGQTCPYCFRGTGSSGDFLTCSVCTRKIHKDCVSNYGNCTPWCYLGVGSDGFRVCVDCWVPELLKNSTRVCGRSENKGWLKEKGESKYLLDNVVKNVKCEVEKKVKSRAKLGKNDRLDFVKDALDLLAKKVSKAENPNCSDSIEVVDDAELSPRISRSKSLVKNSSDLDVSNIGDWNGLSYKGSHFEKNHGEDQKLGTFTNTAENERMSRPGEIDSWINLTNLGPQCYKRDKTRKIWQLIEDNTMVSESRFSQPAEIKCNLNSNDAKTRCSFSSGVGIPVASIRVNADLNNVDRFGQEPVIYRRSRFKRKLFQVNGLVGVSGESSFLDNQGAASKPECCQIDNGELRIGCQVKSDDTKVFLPSGSCDADRDRYHLKYCKRATGTKSGSSFMHFSTLLNQNQASQQALNNSESGFDEERDRYPLKYVKRATCTKLDSSFQLYNTLLSENRVSAPALNDSVVDCSVKSDGKLVLQIGTVNRDCYRYCFKYTRRSKGLEAGSISGAKLHSDAAGLTTNCSAESRTMSDVTCDSFTVSLPK